MRTILLLLRTRTTAEPRTIDVNAIEKRLGELNLHYRIEPSAFCELVKEVRKHMRAAHRAKTEMVEANLRFGY